MARSRIKRAQKADKAIGALLMVIGLLLIATLAGGAWWLKKTREQLDVNNCPIRGPRAIEMVMVDRSDPVTPQQAQRIRQYVHQLKDQAAFGTRFDIYVLEGDTKNELQPVFQVCAPGRPEDANELIENPEHVSQRYNKSFSEAIDRVIDGLLRATTMPNSPLIESLRAAAITSFGADKAQRIPLHVSLISDMIQHSTAVSHFRSAPDFKGLSNSMTWPTLRPDLRGAQVNIFYLLRPSATRANAPVQNRGHQLFWDQLIAASNGRLMKIEIL